VHVLAKVVWGDALSERTVFSELELREVLSELNESAKRGPYIADVTIRRGDTLSVALGRDVSVLSFVSSTLDPPYFASKGRSPRAGDGFIDFLYHGAPTQFPEWQAIPYEAAVDATCLFVSQGTLPAVVDWITV
jgi:hypothetical protein